MRWPRTECGGRYNSSDSGRNRVGWYGRNGHKLMSKYRRRMDKEIVKHAPHNW